MSVRCFWCTDDPLYVEYHDKEWGVPCYDERRLFEMLCLEGAQAGLSWLTILKKREHYRKAFCDFDPEKIARFGEDDVAGLLANAGIVRNRLKVNAFISNARAMLDFWEKNRSFSDFLWAYVDGVPQQNNWRNNAEVPAQTDVSEMLSKDLKRLGFRFVGPTICYAYMQSVGLVNDHTTDCFRHQELR